MTVWNTLIRPLALRAYARRIASKIRDTHHQRPSGLYDHEPYIQKIGQEISDRYGVQGMFDVYDILLKWKGSGPMSELKRIWRGIGNWH